MPTTAAGIGMPPAPCEDAGFGIYVHWPFCASKCPYCDFNSHVRHTPVDQAGFADAIACELGAIADRAGPRVVDSIFFGGGTPSLMTPDTVERILVAIAARFVLPPEIEITLEANPSSVERDRFAGYRAAGVNRLSIGVQSLRDPDLVALGRRHDAATARAAVAVADALFDNYSTDLIYARPGQSVADWRSELADALAIAGPHLSLYQLTIEPDTPFAALHEAGRLTIPGGDLAADLFELTQEACAAAGRPAYEISNHAAPGFECRHNLVYWRSGDWIGIGPGAHGRLTVDGLRTATATERHPETWRAAVEATGTGLVIDEPVEPDAVADEMIVMGLRLAEGIDLDRLEQNTGCRLDENRIALLAHDGLLEQVATNRIRATPAGRLVLDAVIRTLAG